MDKWIASITYGAFEGQSMDITGFDVTFTGAPLDVRSHDFADAVAKIILAGGKSRALRVRGSYPPDTSAYQFVKRFRDDGGWFLVGVSDGQSSHLWDDMLGYRVIELQRPEWPVLRCNELQWHGVNGPEPLLPTPPPKLMLVTDGMSEAGVWHWLDEAKGTWHILTSRKRAFAKVIL